MLTSDVNDSLKLVPTKPTWLTDKPPDEDIHFIGLDISR